MGERERWEEEEEEEEEESLSPSSSSPTPPANRLGSPSPPSRLLGEKGEKNVRVPREEGKKFLPLSPPPREIDIFRPQGSLWAPGNSPREGKKKS